VSASSVDVGGASLDLPSAAGSALGMDVSCVVVAGVVALLVPGVLEGDADSLLLSNVIVSSSVGVAGSPVFSVAATAAAAASASCLVLRSAGSSSFQISSILSPASYLA